MFSYHTGAIRRMPAPKGRYFLTFDDGPHPEFTPRILDCLSESGGKATFFVVGTRAREHPALIDRIVKEGHAVGDHSWDHGYRYFFRSERALESWIRRSQGELSSRLGRCSVGFRPPAGVVTPPLVRVLGQLEIPLILWSRRYFDTQIPFTPRRATRAAGKLVAGDIVLLHDTQPTSGVSALCRISPVVSVPIFL